MDVCVYMCVCEREYCWVINCIVCTQESVCLCACICVKRQIVLMKEGLFLYVHDSV